MDTLRKGARLEVTFAGYDPDGRAVGCGPAGEEIHAPGGVAGETAQVVIEHVSPHRPVAWAKIQRLTHRSPDRAPSAPGAAHQCGGCPWSHLDYGAQLAAKAERLGPVIALVDGVHLAEPLVRPGAPTGYRNRGKYVIARRGKSLSLGGYAPRSHRVISTLGCPVMAPEVDRVARALRRVLERSRLPVFDEKSGQGAG